MEKEGIDSAVAEEVPLLQSGHSASRQVANPPQPFAHDVPQYTYEGRVALQVKKTPDNEPPCCSAYLVFFFLGLFLNPLFFLCGMSGLHSNQPHEYFAGKLSAIGCLVVLPVLALWAGLSASGILDPNVETGEDRY